MGDFRAGAQVFFQLGDARLEPLAFLFVAGFAGARIDYGRRRAFQLTNLCLAFFQLLFQIDQRIFQLRLPFASAAVA